MTVHFVYSCLVLASHLLLALYILATWGYGHREKAEREMISSSGA